MYKVILHILLAVVAAFMFQSCCNDADPDTGQGSNKQKVTISLVQSTQDRTGASLRSMSVAQENEINEIDILAFRKTGGIYKLAYSVKGIDIQQQNPQYEFSTFTAWLETGEQKFVFIANASSYIHNSGIQIGDRFDDIISNLTVDSNSEWLNLYIPMYGEIDTEITNTSTTLSNIYLIRMLARFDISLLNTVTNFNLEEAYIFNRKNKGYIASQHITGNIVTNATVPSDAIQIKTPAYTYTTTSNNEISQSIYTFEVKGVNLSTNKKDATAIVVGGDFNNSGKTTYYRVDIHNPQTSIQTLDILRNHLYNIVIQSVSEAGAPTPEEAFDGIYTLNAEIEVWTNNEIGVDLDEQYYLQVSHPSIQSSAIPADGLTVTAITNHPKGISLENNGSTIDLPLPDEGKSVMTLKLMPTAAGNKFTFIAGNLRYVVTIK